jgi:hypothetical protein
MGNRLMGISAMKERLMGIRTRLATVGIKTRTMMMDAAGV